MDAINFTEPKTGIQGFFQRLLCNHEMEHLVNRFNFNRWETHELWGCKNCSKEEFRNHAQ